MKNILIISVLGLSLAGCAGAGPNQTIGTGVGAVGGYGVARALGAGPRGSAVGAVAGALIGSEVGRNMDQPVYSQPQPVVVQERYVPVRRRPVCHSIWERTYGGYIERRICN